MNCNCGKPATALATLRIFTAVYTWDTTEPAIRPRRFLWPPR